jgi:hypothetical protein
VALLRSTQEVYTLQVFTDRLVGIGWNPTSSDIGYEIIYRQGKFREYRVTVHPELLKS